MSDFYDDFYEGYDQVEASQGLTSEPLPTDFYALKIEKVLGKEESRNKVPQVRLQLLVTEGPLAGRRAFVRQSLGASRVDGDGKEKTASEYAQHRATMQAQMKGLLKAIGVQQGAPVGDGAAKAFNFFAVDQWEGREFVGKIRLQEEREYKGKTYDASNQLQNFYPLDDPKRGIGWLRERLATTPAAGSAQAAEV